MGKGMVVVMNTDKLITRVVTKKHLFYQMQLANLRFKVEQFFIDT